jgi:polysaccharide biosynthesis protein PslJ
VSDTTAGSLAFQGRDEAARAAPDARADDWPHTKRVMPWLVAGFLGMVWLIPFDAIEITSISAPVDLKLDRIVIFVVALFWLAALGAGPRFAPRFRRSPMNWAVFAFLLVAVAGVAANQSTLVIQTEVGLAIKKLALLFSFAALFFLVTSTVRPTEVPRYLLLMLVLACITAVGVIVEYRTKFNVFYYVSAKVFPAPFYVNPKPPDLPFARRSITGPTLHGIAVATLFGMLLPFAIVGALRNHGRPRWAYVGVVAILLIGALGTQRKAGLVVPAAAVLTLLFYRPRLMIRLVPAGLVVIAAVFLLAHGAAVGVKAQFVGANLDNASTTGRTSDYDATRPDIFKYPLLGRGEGTYDPFKYRFLDNEYLHRIIEMGFLGLAAYLGLILTAAFTGHGVVRRLGPIRGSPGMAAVAACGAFAACSAVFDAMSYPQPMYVFMCIAGLMVCYAASERDAAD